MPKSFWPVTITDVLKNPKLHYCAGIRFSLPQFSKDAIIIFTSSKYWCSGKPKTAYCSGIRWRAWFSSWNKMLYCNPFLCFVNVFQSFYGKSIVLFFDISLPQFSEDAIIIFTSSKYWCSGKPRTNILLWNQMTRMIFIME